MIASSISYSTETIALLISLSSHIQIPTTVPKPFNLGLNKRVEDRKNFQADLAKRQQDAEQREMTRKEERDEEDRRALKEYRKSLVFKASRPAKSLVLPRGF